MPEAPEFGETGSNPPEAAGTLTFKDVREDLVRLRMELRDDATRLVNQAENIRRYLETTYQKVAKLINDKKESFENLVEAARELKNAAEGVRDAAGELAAIPQRVDKLSEEVRQLRDDTGGVVKAMNELPSHIEVRAAKQTSPRWLVLFIVFSIFVYLVLLWAAFGSGKSVVAAAPQALRHDAAVLGLGISGPGPGPVVLVSLDGKGRGRLWWMPSAVRYRALELRGARVVALSPDGTIVAADDPASYGVQLWNLAQMRRLAVLNGHTDSINALAFSRDGTLLASGSDDHTAILWSWATGRRLHTMETGGPVLSVALSPDGSLAAGCSDTENQVWVRRSDGRLWSATGYRGPVRAVAFSPDGGKVAAGGDDGRIGLHQFSEPRWSPLEGPERPVRAVSFSPDGTLLVSGSEDGTVRLWDVEKRAQVQVLGRHEGPVTGVEFVPVWGWIASSSEDGTVRFWRAS